MAGKVNVVAHSMGGLVLKICARASFRPSCWQGGICWRAKFRINKAYKVLMIGDGFGITGLNDEEIKNWSEHAGDL